MALAAVCLTLPPPAHAQSPTVCAPGTKPDVIVGDLVGRTRHGVVGDITAFSIGTTSCNIGNCNLNWISGTNDHPVISQNMYRLKAGRFEHIGQSWLKHGFTALQGQVCSTSCIPSGSGSYLGINCSDPYSSSLNGSQTRLGPKFEVNAYTGVFPYPATNQSNTGNAIYKRLQVRNADLDPGLNAGALYFVDSQYIAKDDATAANGLNNASWRPISVTGTPGSGVYDITLTGVTNRMLPGIYAWRATDPSVILTDAPVPGEGRFIIGAKVTALGGGFWEYEYAVYNQNSHRSGRAFTVGLPPGAIVTSAGFHDLDYHSGEPFSSQDWDIHVGPDSVVWSTKPFADDPNSNALRWDTLYNFRCVVNVAPATGNVRLELFRPGAPNEISASSLVPNMCNNNGICEPGETCASCAADCSGQGGGTGCCGNSLCEAGESPCRCAADCGPQMPNETSCTNGVDEDCDGLVDCADVDCCRHASCDGDGDTHGPLCDCDDANPNVWATPGEVRAVVLAPDPVDGMRIEWDAATGGTVATYDVLRSAVVDDFMAPAACLTLPDPNATRAPDPLTPDPGTAFHYLVRAKNACPVGTGTLGTNWSGVPRTGRSCP